MYLSTLYRNIINVMHRKQDYTCTCNAYTFPHRIFSGRCVSEIVEQNVHGSHCQNCNLYVDKTCQVLDGLEHVKYCEYVSEFILYHEIRVHKSKWYKW